MTISDSIIVEVPVVSIVVDEQVTELLFSQMGVQGIPGPQGITPMFTRQNEISPVVGLTRFYFDTPKTISQVRASLGIVATGSPVVIDVLVNGVSIGTTSIPANQNTATHATSTLVGSGDYVTISILSVGSTFSGSDLTVVLTIA